jgi:deoxyadenosine/deoxycytidine kinase
MIFQRAIKIILITFIISKTMHAQQNFGSYTNKIFFNVFYGTPDSGIQQFLNTFVPVLLQQSERNTKWSAYTAGDITKPTVIAHSLIFHKHPFIDADIKQGEFKVYTTVYNDAVYLNSTGIKDIQVILEFEKLDSALRLFEKLRKDLTALGKEQTYFEDKARRFFVVYSHEIMYDIPAKLRIHLVEEGGVNNLYQLIINSD